MIATQPELFTHIVEVEECLIFSCVPKRDKEVGE